MPFNEAKFDLIYKDLPKKYFAPSDGYSYEERVELEPLWAFIETEAAVDGVLFKPFKQMEISSNDDEF